MAEAGALAVAAAALAVVEATRAGVAKAAKAAEAARVTPKAEGETAARAGPAVAQAEAAALVLRGRRTIRCDRPMTTERARARRRRLESADTVAPLCAIPERPL